MNSGHLHTKILETLCEFWVFERSKSTAEVKSASELPQNIQPNCSTALHLRHCELETVAITFRQRRCPQSSSNIAIGSLAFSLYNKNEAMQAMQSKSRAPYVSHPTRWSYQRGDAPMEISWPHVEML